MTWIPMPALQLRDRLYLDDTAQILAVELDAAGQPQRVLTMRHVKVGSPERFTWDVRIKPERYSRFFG